MVGAEVRAGILYIFLMDKLDILLRTDYPPEVCAANLIEQTDCPQRTLFSFSGYKGEKPVLGVVSGSEFCLHKRRYWRNDFGPLLYGRIISEGRSSRIEAYWGIQRWTRLFMRVWLVFAALIGIPIFINSLYQFLSGAPTVQGDLYVGLLVPPGMVLFGVLLPRLGSLLSFPERAFLIEFLERVLVAHASQEVQEREWRSTLE
jgi:hypothetical protein